MADIRNRFLVWKWSCGIAAITVALGLVWHVMRPGPRRDAIAPTEFDGFVADIASRQLLRNSLVTVSLGGYSAQQRTDTFGRYSIVFPSPSADASIAVVEVNAEGYRASRNNISLRPGNNFAEILLTVAPYTSQAEMAQRVAPGGAATLRSASEPGAETAVRAEIISKKLPSDFMRAPAIYAAMAKK